MSLSRPLLSHRPARRLLLLAVASTACSGKAHTVHDGGAVDVTPDAAVIDARDAVDGGMPSGRWTTGDLHVHTIQSNDAQVALRDVLDAAFVKYHLDWVALSNHLRVSDRDDLGNAIPTGPVPASKGIALYEVPAIAALQQAGTYADKTIFSSAEWDMPTHEHFNIGILADAALNQFEYLFTKREASMFDAADVAAWGDERWATSHEDALHAIAWLKEHYPDRSYGIVTHPSRNAGRYSITHLRELNDLAPDIVFAIEGMLGNQMEPDRGGYSLPYTEENAPYRTYGGCDFMISRVGGVWDALLGEGRRMWSVGDSDFHFKTAGGLYSSGYFPGEYTKNHVWVDGEGMPAILRGLRAGKAFSVTGDLISALDFTIASPSVAAAEMGGELRVNAGATVTITIRFKSGVPSNYETPVGSGNIPGAIPVVGRSDRGRCRRANGARHAGLRRRDQSVRARRRPVRRGGLGHRRAGLPRRDLHGDGHQGPVLPPARHQPGHRRAGRDGAGRSARRRQGRPRRQRGPVQRDQRPELRRSVVLLEPDLRGRAVTAAPEEVREAPEHAGDDCPAPCVRAIADRDMGDERRAEGEGEAGVGPLLEPRRHRREQQHHAEELGQGELHPEVIGEAEVGERGRHLRHTQLRVGGEADLHAEERGGDPEAEARLGDINEGSDARHVRAPCHVRDIRSVT